MKAPKAVEAFSALAHESRLRLYRLLVQAGPDGLSAGTLAARLGMPPSSLSFHVQQLHRAGLISQRRASRQLFYAADFDSMNALIAYLTENCCGGNAQACAPAQSTRSGRSAA